MKKSIIIAGLFLSGVLFMTNCGSKNIEADAKKVAELQCKAQKIATQLMAGDTTINAESAKIQEEAAKLAEEMKGKYTNPIDVAKFAAAYGEAMKDCK